jgi:putative ABC transport system ATP-binding protein
MGPSGSGKSTAMNILGCLDTPDSGQPTCSRASHVEALSRDQRARLRRRYLGFVFQGFNLLARTSAQENVELPLLYRGERRARGTPPPPPKGAGSVGLGGWEHHTRPNCRAGSSSAWPLPAPSSPSRPCCWPTSPPATSTPSAATRSWACCWRLNRDHGITVLMVTHEPDMAAYARRMVRFVDGASPSDTRQPAPVPRRPLHAVPRQREAA